MNAISNRTLRSLNPGNTVQLKSGGPKMTVSHLEKGTWGDTLYCEWFDGKTVQHWNFKPTSLDLCP